MVPSQIGCSTKGLAQGEGDVHCVTAPHCFHSKTTAQQETSARREAATHSDIAVDASPRLVTAGSVLPHAACIMTVPTLKVKITFLFIVSLVNTANT
jgi:hypothetical protein